MKTMAYDISIVYIESAIISLQICNIIHVNQ